MGSGRDKRRKNEDPEKVAKRAARQATKATRNQKDDDNNNGGTGGLDGEEDIAVTAAKFIKRSEKRKTVLEKDLPGPPEPRSNALWVAHPTRDDEYILFGGECWNGESTVTYNQLIIYNSARNTWREIESPLTPCPRSSCQGWTHRNYLFVHGGEITSRTQSQFLHFRDLWRFDVNLCVWEELSKGKGGPSARSGHRIAQWKRGAVLYGGFYDNGQETRYFDDLWVLSEVDSGGVWREVTMASHVEKPQSRSGHVLSMYNDELFLFGGYYTHRASRFQRAEATVLHDLWTVNMASPTPVWQRLKLAGIPPPIRSGFGHAFKDKRLFLFGGVVDLDGAGGKTVSTFCNDLFVFNMENKRFFPMTLHAPKAKATKQTGAAAAAAAGGDLAAEIAAAVGRKVVDSDSSDDDSVDLLPEPAEPQAPRAALQVTESFVQGAPGQILPCRRMNAHLCVDGNRLVIFGGQFEVGRREVPLCDVFSLNLNKMDTYVCHVSCDVRAVEWLGGDTENSGAGSWEDGSTVADLDALLDRDDDLEEEEASAAAGRSQAPEDDDDDVVPVPAAFAAMAAAATAVDADGRTTVRGKVGRQHHKEQLKAQLSSTSAIPTPQLEETLKQFFDRTESFWLASAAENIPSEGVSARKYEKRLREAAQQYCHMRYDEAIDLLRQIEFVERQQAEEEEALREMLRKRREYEAAAAAAAEAEEAEESEDDA